MAWIESHQEIVDHPKTRRAARLLGVDIPTLVGHLHILWHWVLNYAEDGDLSGLGCDEIAYGARWQGDAELFLGALIQAGWIDQDDTRCCIHDWQDYAGRLVEYRQKKTQRSKRNRELYGDYEVIYEVRQRDGDLCRYCGTVVNWRDRKSSAGGTYDHIDPEGANSADNIVVACRGCNARKGRRTPDQALMPLLLPGPTTNLPETCQESTTVHNSTEPNTTLENHTSSSLAVAVDQPQADEEEEEDDGLKDVQSLDKSSVLYKVCSIIETAQPKCPKVLGDDRAVTVVELAIQDWKPRNPVAEAHAFCEYWGKQKKVLRSPALAYKNWVTPAEERKNGRNSNVVPFRANGSVPRDERSDEERAADAMGWGPDAEQNFVEMHGHPSPYAPYIKTRRRAR